MLYNSSESLKILFSKKPQDGKMVNLESDFQVSNQSRHLLTVWSRVRDLASAIVHIGPNDFKETG